MCAAAETNREIWVEERGEKESKKVVFIADSIWFLEGVHARGGG